MREIVYEELSMVSGGNALDSTTGSFVRGDTTSSANSGTTVCYGVQVGPTISKTCYDSEGTETVYGCIGGGVGIQGGPVGVGVSVQVCSPVAKQSKQSYGSGGSRGRVPNMLR